MSSDPTAARNLPRERKIFAGGRIRRLRRELGLSQARMAADLGISASYQNLIECNQRPLTARILLGLAEHYDVDLKSLSADADSGTLAAVREAFEDPVLATRVRLADHELRELAATSPAAAQAIATLFRAYQDSRASASTLAEQLAGQTASAGATRLPVEEVRDLFHDRLNHFPALDEAAEALYESAALGSDEPYLALRALLRDRHGVSVRILPLEVSGPTLRRYDYHRRCIYLSEVLEQAGRNFHLAYQLALFEARPAIDGVVAGAGLSSDESRRICRIGLASYFAGALLMPYERFRIAADSLRHDIEALCRRFATSFEQVCHRLTTLHRSAARGIPFFLVRVDAAGNVTKRFSPIRFPFARYGGACPKWNVHDAFRTPGAILRQIIEMPDGKRYFSIARTVTRPGLGASEPDQILSIGLGCDIEYAPRLIYGDGFDFVQPLATPVGPNCLLCERPDCHQRAFPPLKARLSVNENARGIYAFDFDADQTAQRT